MVVWKAGVEMKFTDFSKALSHISVAAARLKSFEDLSDAEILEFQRMLWDAFGNFRAACNTPKLPNEIKLRLLRAVEAIKRSCKNTQPDNPAAISWIIRISKSETLDDELLEFLWASKEANEYITVTHGFYADVFNADLDASKLEGLPRTPTAIESPESYKWPASYERDKWIYDYIPKHSCSDTVTALEKLAIKKNWDLVTSRNGLKKAAKRYADFHGFESVNFSQP